ncbi:MAG: ATP-binding cassette domain-containing protein, partial [Pseudolabrys sp.]|nr:ATP-binding cassette domain-containing protein [Pseudolabrys sp.]
FHREYSVYAYSDADSRQWQLIPRLGIEIVGVTALVAMALGALVSGMSRADAASILALYAVVTIRLMPVIGEVASAVSSIQVSLPQLTHLRDLREDLPAHYVPVVKDDRLGNWREVSLDNVSYRYDNADRLALENISLTFKRGRSYGLVGSSGAGKSTVADIIASLLTPTTGVLAVDGVGMTDGQSLAAWRSRVSYVAQHPVIFDATLADNIILGAPKTGDCDQRLAGAIAAAGLTSVVNALEQKLDTQIGDRGTRLSGGQRQRVAIARAIFQQAELLILDEATSALDSLTERDFANAMDALKGRVTILAIAHRLSTVMRCDEIVVLDRGRIAALGSHPELIASSDEYRRFVEAQSMDNEIARVAK